MIEDAITIFRRNENSDDKLVDAYDVLSYIDNISADEMENASKLIKEELSSILDEFRKEGKKNDLEEKKCQVEKKKEEEYSEKRIESFDIQENKTMANIKLLSSEIQYNYITRVNLQLLREFGDEAWENQIKVLKGLKQKCQQEQNYLKKSMKQISINRKKRQLEFQDNQLGPLLDGLKTIQNENNSLTKTLIKKIRENNRE